jgi:glycosyltransferase involved in cell wall biosynthesis
LLNTLQHLLPQLDEQCEVLILDNASDIPVEYFLNENLPQKDAGPFGFRVIRNGANIGIGANILRCIEMSAGEWTWIIGDDDMPHPCALSKILKEVRGFDGIYVVFSHVFRKLLKPQVGSGKLEFLKSPITWFGMAFLPLGVYRTTKCRNVLFSAYNTVSTANPHTALMLMAIGEKGKWKFSSDEIVLETTLPVDEKWNTIKGLDCVAFFPEFLAGELSREENALFSMKIFNDTGPNSFKGTYAFFFQILMQVTKIPEDYDLYKLYFSRWVNKSIGKGVYFRSVKLFAKILDFALAWPKISFFLFQLYNFAHLRRLKPYKVFANIRRKDF